MANSEFSLRIRIRRSEPEFVVPSPPRFSKEIIHFGKYKITTFVCGPGQAKPGQVKPSQARPGQARPGQARPG